MRHFDDQNLFLKLIFYYDSEFISIHSERSIASGDLFLIEFELLFEIDGIEKESWFNQFRVLSEELKNSEWTNLIKVKFLRFENTNDEKEAWNSKNIHNSFADHIPICCSFFNFAPNKFRSNAKKENTPKYVLMRPFFQNTAIEPSIVLFFTICWFVFV